MHKIGRYEIERELGRGAMGIVYLARDTRLGRAVALKTIRLGDFADAEKLQRLRERLIREAQSAGSLSHENIVIIYDVDELDEISYISMEFVEGESLERVLERRREMSRETLLSLIRQTASGLDFAHSRGIVHRDVKPPNVMVTPLGKVKLTDFGVAKVTYASSMTQGGAMLGTPDYMSPEQIDGHAVDGRADQFSLGVIAYELLTGEKPFIADSLAALFYRIAHEPAPDATLLNPSLSPEVGEVLLRAMAKRPEQRYPNCMAFADALTDACARTVGWHALPRGMSHTLPTAHDPAPATTPPVGAPSVVAPHLPPILVVAPSAQPQPTTAAPAPIPTAPRNLRPLGGSPPVPEAGFITAAPMDSVATLEGAPPASRDWLRTVEEEEAQQRARRRRTVLAAVLTFLILGGGLAAAYYWLGGDSLLRMAGIPSGAAQIPEEIFANPEGETQTGSAELPADGAEAGETPISDPEAEQTDTAETETATEETATSSPAADAPKTAEPTKPEPPTPEPSAPKQAARRPVASKPPAAEPKPATRTVAPPAERKATVRFMTEPPGARITVDAAANLSCESPCSLDIAVGRHTYSARMPGYRNEIRAIEVGNYGATVNVRMERAMGMVRVSSMPSGASVLVNGERQSGVTPLTLRLLPGNYRILIERDGQRIERNVRVEEDAVVQLSASLEP